MSTPRITIYTDGAALGNPGPGGYGAVLMYGEHRREISGSFRRTTNNRMELLAVIKALEMIKQPGIPVSIYTDSKYVHDAIVKNWIAGWQRKGWVKVKNPDLWKQLIPLNNAFKPEFNWVKGHAGNVSRHGFAEDIIPESLDAGEKRFNEKNQVREKKETKSKTCPQCYQIMVGIRCKCGYEIPIKEQIVSDKQELKKLKSVSKEDKARWYGEFVLYAATKGYKPGYASHLYRQKFGVWPKVQPDRAVVMSQDVLGFIQHTFIKRAKGALNDRNGVRKTG